LDVTVIAAVVIAVKIEEEIKIIVKRTAQDSKMRAGMAVRK